MLLRMVMASMPLLLVIVLPRVILGIYHSCACRRPCWDWKFLTQSWFGIWERGPRLGNWYLVRSTNPRHTPIFTLSVQFRQIFVYMFSPLFPITRFLFEIYKFLLPPARLERWAAMETSWVLLNGIKYWIFRSAVADLAQQQIKFYANHLRKIWRGGIRKRWRKNAAKTKHWPF